MQGPPAHAAMHRGLAYGFRSTATQQSQVVNAVPLQKGSIIEALAQPGRVDFLVTFDPEQPAEYGLQPYASSDQSTYCRNEL